MAESAEVRSMLPHLRIGQLAAATGVDATTLRSWEARYGVPAPARTLGGQRRYPPSEVERIASMRRLIDAGFRAAEAARAVEELARPATPSVLDPSAVDLVALLIEGDLDALRALDALAAAEPLETIVVGRLAPALRSIGDRWAAGELSVAQEHAASALVGAWLGAQQRIAPPALRHGLVVTAAPEGERHEIGLLMVGALLRRQGVGVVHLGCDLPAPDLAAMVASKRADVVCLGVLTDRGEAGYVAAVRALDALEPRPLIAAGGAFQAPEVSGAEVEHLGDDLGAATARLTSLL